MLQFTAVIPIVGNKSIWEVQQHAGSSRDVHRLTGHDRGIRTSEAANSGKETILTDNRTFCTSNNFALLNKKIHLLCSSFNCTLYK